MKISTQKTKKITAKRKVEIPSPMTSKKKSRSQGNTRWFCRKLSSPWACFQNGQQVIFLNTVVHIVINFTCTQIQIQIGFQYFTEIGQNCQFNS